MKIQERGGALEISVARPARPLSPPAAHAPSPGGDVVLRVKVVRITDTEIVVEPPAAFGESIRLKRGVELIGAMTVGQNRWMFHTRTLGERESAGLRQLLLALPTGVERCTRRHFYRISTADLQLPDVQCWPLLDPASVVPAETANRVQIESITADMRAGRSVTPDPEEIAEPTLLPDVGPLFTAKLVNMSGGGLGLRIGPGESSAVERRPFLWLRVDLRPQIPVPIAVTARLAHTHIDSGQNLYAGVAFDFAHNPEHRRFIIEKFSGYVDMLQSEQQRLVRAAG